MINEFVASNSSGLLDDNGNTSDWIELFNDGGPAVDLAGYTLTDDAGNPSKFVFPDQTLASNQYLVVFAADDTDTATGIDLYTGFGLSSSGEYLGLYDPAGNVVSEFAAGGGDYPAQSTDVSYGFLNDGSFSQPNYFATPSPGFSNIDPVDGIVERVTSSLTPGFFETTQIVSLSTATPDATIYYTTDGSSPSATNGSIYSGPLSISGTTTLRAVANKTSFAPVPSRTWSYFFLDDIVAQTDAPPEGWPATWGSNTVDYAFDTGSIAAEGGEQVLKDSLLAIPSWSITTDLDNLFDLSSGIYANAIEDGIEWERPVSLEQLNPDGSEGFQVNAGIRIRGGVTRQDRFSKHALKFFFRGEYGDSSLEYNVFSDDPTATTSFEKIDIRTTRPGNSYIIDELSRENQAALGEPATRSTWVHLYINGQYWGLYQPQERADANFGASYFGGTADDYDVIKPERTLGLINIATDGNFDAYQELHAQSLARAADGVTPAFVDNAAYLKAQGLNPDGTDNPEYKTLLDVDNLIAYMLVIIHSGNDDGPINDNPALPIVNNYFAVRNRNGDEGFRFFTHDNERTFSNRFQNRDRTDAINHERFEDPSSIYFNPQWLHQQLMANADYRIAFADKVQEAFYNDGPLSNSALAARFDDSAAFIDQAIIAELARWGDQNIVRNNWVGTVSSLRNLVLARENLVVQQLKTTELELKDSNGFYTVAVDAPLFPDVEAPTFQVDGTPANGGGVTPRSPLFINASDTVFYTVDGSDPRLPGGEINPAATSLTSTSSTTDVVVSGEDWNFYDDTGNDDLGNAWQNEAFDDSAWESGPSSLGYGDNQITTVGFGGDSSNRNITTYFRKTFDVDPGNYSSAILNLKWDDGVIVYSEWSRNSSGKSPRWRY